VTTRNAAKADPVAEAIRDVLISPNLPDTQKYGESANLVDAMTDVARAIRSGLKWLGTGDAATPMGALEAHAVLLKEGVDGLRSALSEIAESIRELADAVRQRDLDEDTN
jgi:hypothetical protein